MTGFLGGGVELINMKPRLVCGGVTAFVTAEGNEG